MHIITLESFQFNPKKSLNICVVATQQRDTRSETVPVCFSLRSNNSEAHFFLQKNEHFYHTVSFIFKFHIIYLFIGFKFLEKNVLDVIVKSYLGVNQYYARGQKVLASDN